MRRLLCAAAIARRVYLRGNVGVGAMRKIYGGRQRRGTVKEKFCVSGTLRGNCALPPCRARTDRFGGARLDSDPRPSEREQRDRDRCARTPLTARSPLVPCRTRAGGSIPRHILIELEKMKIVEKAESSKGGRRITETGQRDLDSIAGQIKAADN